MMIQAKHDPGRFSVRFEPHNVRRLLISDDGCLATSFKGPRLIALQKDDDRVRKDQRPA